MSAAAVAALAGAWVACLAVPLVWWWRRGRRLDVWAALPVPAAMLDRTGRVVAATGPDGAGPAGLELVPPPGAVLRMLDTDGRPAVVRGLAGGALAVGWPDGGATLAEDRDRLARDLTLRLAHDLASPLMAVHGHLDLIAHEPIGAVAARSLDLAVAEVERAVALTRDVATLTSLRAGAAGVSVELAGALAEEAVTGLLATADRLGARLTVSTPAEPARVAVMSGALIRAVRNLVANALAHGLGERREVAVVVTVCSRDDGPHSPAATRGSARVRFAVEDSGAGLTQAQLAQLSRPLVRGEGSQGAGLGLAIVEEVLTAHGSRLVSGRSRDGAAAVWFDLAAVDHDGAGSGGPG